MADQRLERVPTTSISTRRFARDLRRSCCRPRAALALALGVDAVLLDALGLHVGLHRFSASDGQRAGCRHRSDRIGVTDRDDHFQVDAAHLAHQVVELGLALGLQHGLVEVEERVGGVGDLGRGRSGRSRRGGTTTAAGGGGWAAGGGAAAAGGGGGGIAAPSQPGTAVAGVQLASRQQCSLVPLPHRFAVPSDSSDRCRTRT